MISQKKDLIIFLGPPGSGKGSLSNLAVKNLGFEQISTGNLCRQHISEQTEIGKQIDLIIKTGKLISDDIINNMVFDCLLNTNNTNSIILDGFPRTVVQAEALKDFISKNNNFNLSIVRLSVEDDKLIKRIISRVVCSNLLCQRVFSLEKDSQHCSLLENNCDDCSSKLVRRKDDIIESIKERLNIYRQHETNLINYFIFQDFKILEIFADQSIADIFYLFTENFGVLHNDNNQK